MTYTIGINEFYDPTEYMNISTDSSVSSTYSDVNRRYWELTSAAKTKMMGYDGNAFKLAEIERFYLSTLNMKHDLGTTNSDLTNSNPNKNKKSYAIVFEAVIGFISLIRPDEVSKILDDNLKKE